MRQALELIASIVICELVGVIGGLFTAPAIATWYNLLRKPSFNPPAWVFGPVWTALYLMMGVAAFLVWRKGWGNAQVKVALVVFGLQLLLNFLWSPVFFGMRSPLGGLLVIVPLWGAILATIVLFARVSVPVAVLMVPYLLWVSFATVLNYALYLLNA